MGREDEGDVRADVSNMMLNGKHSDAVASGEHLTEALTGSGYIQLSEQED